MRFCWCRAGPGPQAATSGENRRCRTSTWSYSEICDLNSRLHKFLTLLMGKMMGIFWTTPCRNIIIIFCRGWPGTFQPPKKNTRTAVGLFSKNQSYLEMIHPPMNWHSYGNPWVSSWKMLQMMFLFGIFGADRSGPSHISSRQGQMPQWLPAPWRTQVAMTTKLRPNYGGKPVISYTYI